MNKYNNCAVSVFKTTFFITLMMLFFKGVAFVKQAVIAAYFGATVTTDIYFLSSEFITGISQTFVAAICYSFIPVYSGIRGNSSQTRTSALFRSLLLLLTIFSCIVCIGIILFAPGLSMLLAPGFNHSELQILQKFLRVMSVGCIFYAVINLHCALLDAEQHFAVPRMQSLILSVSMILACVILANKISVYALVAGQYLAYFIFGIILFVSVRRFISGRLFWPGKELAQILKLAIPVFLGYIFQELGQIAEKAISTTLETGAVSALSYSRVLIQLVTSVLIANIGNILLSHFSVYAAKKEKRKLQGILEKALNLFASVLLPISAITFLCAEDIVRLVYYRGSFSENSVALTTLAVKGYAVGFLFFGIREILSKSMYALKNTKSPEINNAVSILLYVFLCAVFSRFLGVQGIALGSSLSAVMTVVLNIHSFKKMMPFFSFTPLMQTVLKNIPALIIMCMLAKIIQPLISNCFLRLSLITLIGLPAYALILYLTGVQEITQFVKKSIKH